MPTAHKMHAHAAFRWLLAIYLKERRDEIPFVLIHALALPAVFCYLGVMLAGDDHRMLARWTSGALTLAIATTATSLGGGAVLTDRFAGRLQLLRTTATPKLAYYAVHATLAVCATVIMVLVAAAVLSLTGLGKIGLAGLAAALLASAFAGASVAGLGAVIACKARALEEGQNGLILGSIGLTLLSPVFFEPAALPLPLSLVARLSPFTHLAALMRSVLGNEAPPLGALLWIVGLGLMLHWVSFRSIRWDL